MVFVSLVRLMKCRTWLWLPCASLANTCTAHQPKTTRLTGGFWFAFASDARSLIGHCVAYICKLMGRVNHFCPMRRDCTVQRAPNSSINTTLICIFSSIMRKLKMASVFHRARAKKKWIFRLVAETWGGAGGDLLLPILHYEIESIRMQWKEGNFPWLRICNCY